MNKAMLLGLFRHVLTIAGGYLAAKGLLDPLAVDSVVGAVYLLVLNCLAKQCVFVYGRRWLESKLAWGVGVQLLICCA